MYKPVFDGGQPVQSTQFDQRHCTLRFQWFMRDYKTFFKLNSAEHKIYPAHKC